MRVSFTGGVMGIVVTIVMLLGLLALYGQKYTSGNRVQLTIICLLVLLGAWNAFWHGIQYWPVFWAKAAVISGTFMMLSASLLLVKKYSIALSFLKSVAGKVLVYLTIAGLLCSFLLYAVTLIQLNMGYPIIR